MTLMRLSFKNFRQNEREKRERKESPIMFAGEFSCIIKICF